MLSMSIRHLHVPMHYHRPVEMSRCTRRTQCTYQAVGSDQGSEAASPEDTCAFCCCRSRTITRIRIPSQPSNSDFILRTYWSIPPCYCSDLANVCLRCKVAIYLFDGLQCTCGHLDLHKVLESVGKKPFGLNVWQPSAACLVLRKWHIVPILLDLALEQAELGALEWCANHSEEWDGGKHAGEDTASAWSSYPETRYVSAAASVDRTQRWSSSSFHHNDHAGKGHVFIYVRRLAFFS